MKNRTYTAVLTEAEAREPRRPFGLQLFADGGDEGGDSGSGDGDSGGDDSGNEGDGGKKKSPKRTYDDAEVDRIVAKHRAEWEKQHAKDLKAAKDEARKYERMSKEQREEADRKKAEEEAAEKDARIAELEREIEIGKLRDSVAADVEAMPDGVTPTQDFLDLVVTGDADTTKENVKKLMGIIRDVRKKQEEKRATGRTPKSYGNNTGGDMTEIQKRIAKYK